MKHSERFALNQWLSDYPDDASYADLISMLEGDEPEWSHPDISVWEQVENNTLDQVAMFIEDTRRAFENAVANMKEGQTHE